MDDLISRQDAIRWVKTECNPYGKPTLDFESGKRVMRHLEQMPPAQPEERKESLCKKVRVLCEESKIEFFFVGGGESTWSVTNDKHIKKIVECHKTQLSQEGTTKDATSDTISRQAAIDEEIRCAMCRNQMKTDRGCDGNCQVDENLCKEIILILEKHLPPTQPHLITEIQNGIKATNTDDVYSCGMRNGMRWCISLIDDKEPLYEKLPSAQPERMSGEWVKISPANIYECSKCGKNVMTDDISEYDFCHGCGADMRGTKVKCGDEDTLQGGLMSAT